MSEAALFATMTFSEIYEQQLVGPLFRPFAEAVIARINPAPGDRLLDVACGTGIVARVARERMGAGAAIVGVDASPQMLAVARKIDPATDWRQGNAAQLPVADGEHFSVVTCHQGLQFFPDRLAAVREMHRVLSPGGRVAIATWRPLEESTFFHELHPIAEAQLGPITDARHGLGDGDAIVRLLADAGYEDAGVETMRRNVRMPDGKVFARLNAAALASMSEQGKSLSEEERQCLIARIADDSAGVVDKYIRNGALVFELATNIATARRRA